MNKWSLTTPITTAGAAALLVLPGAAQAAPAGQAAERASQRAAVVAYWTPERLAAAQPRDLVVDEKGQWYLRGRGGKLTPYGKGGNAPSAKPDNPGGGNGNGGGGGGDTPDVKNAEWQGGGPVQDAAGRIYFVMDGSAYVCSGTLVNDGSTTNNRSVILTAGHCVYDDVTDTFSELALFIPNQSASGTRTDSDCSNDLYGCWAAEFGVVSKDWAANDWPNNIPYDYAYYVVTLGGSNNTHLDNTLTPMDVAFDSGSVNAFTHALGYSYSNDPNFMYCAEAVSYSSYDGWLLGNCALSGGASGGPWTQSTESDLGTGPLISVNSYGPSRGKSYMGGPRLGADASCLFARAINGALNAPGRGYVGC